VARAEATVLATTPSCLKTLDSKTELESVEEVKIEKSKEGRKEKLASGAEAKGGAGSMSELKLRPP